MLHRHPVMHRYLTDLHFKAEVSLRASFAVTLAFCAYKAALVSIFFLQASLLSAFGDGGSWQRAMNAGTGAAVFVLIAVMAIGMMMTGMKAEKA